MKKLLFFLLCAAIFFVPFFWLKGGNINIGGDSSRLYLYDPANYLKSFPLYSISPSETGQEGVSYFFIPLTFFFLGIKSIFNNPQTVINIFHGLSFLISFVSVYFIVLELLGKQKNEKKVISYAAGMAAGFFYVFSPTIGNWNNAIASHNQIFLNPLIFLLLFLLIKTKNLIFGLLILLISFIFSLNFSFVSAPPIFAFYPAAILFLFVYLKFIRKISFPIKKILLLIFLLIIIQSFHILPQLFLVFNKGSDSSQRVFSTKAISEGISYFLSVAPGVRVSANFIGSVQRVPVLSDFLLFIFPVLILSGFLLNSKIIKKNREIGYTFLLISSFFIVFLFFDSANVTSLGLSLYKMFFKFPGFSMFRNFYGQFMYSFFFFYSLLIGFSAYYLISYLKGRLRKLLVFSLFSIILFMGWPFLNGEMVNLTVSGTKNVKGSFEMDPKFEDVLEFIRNQKTDGKYLTLPITDFGYELLAGKRGGLYIGPSIIGYLTGREDFPGYMGFGPFGDSFLKQAKEKNYDEIRQLLSKFEIKYIFYNSDPYILEKNFKGFPYGRVNKFLPNQKSNLDLIKGLEAFDIKDFGNKYHIYSLKDSDYIPHFYVSPMNIYSNIYLPSWNVLKDFDKRVTILNVASYKKNGNLILEANTMNPLLRITDNSHLHNADPYISTGVTAFYYPLGLLLENFKLKRIEKNTDDYLITSLLYLTKRVKEIEEASGKPGNNFSILGKNCAREDIKVWQVYRWREYNSWEASLCNYSKESEKIIDWLDKQNFPDDWKTAEKIKISEQLEKHQVGLISLISSSIILEDKEKEYLRAFLDGISNSLQKKLSLQIADISVIKYEVNVPEKAAGDYNLLFENRGYFDEQLSQAFIKIGNRILRPINNDFKDKYINFGLIPLEGKTQDIQVNIVPRNLIDDASPWTGSGESTNNNVYTSLTINDQANEGGGGLKKEIKDWQKERQYLISFDYLTQGLDFELAFYEKRQGENKNTWPMRLFEKNLNSRSWSTSKSVITSNIDSIGGFIKILSKNQKEKSKINIRNLSVTEVKYPELVITSIKEKNKNSVLPKIKFTKINPSKYKIEVKGAKDSYTLVFLGAFNSHWKVYLSDEKINNGENTIASYFNGDVSEGNHQSTVLNDRTFETWTEKEIAKNNHFVVGGYANAWQINPDETGGKSDYVLIVENGTQKVFNISMIISILGLLFTIILILILSFKKLIKK